MFKKTLKISKLLVNEGASFKISNPDSVRVKFKVTVKLIPYKVLKLIKGIDIINRGLFCPEEKC